MINLSDKKMYKDPFGYAIQDWRQNGEKISKIQIRFFPQLSRDGFRKARAAVLEQKLLEGLFSPTNRNCFLEPLEINVYTYSSTVHRNQKKYLQLFFNRIPLSLASISITYWPHNVATFLGSDIDLKLRAVHKELTTKRTLIHGSVEDKLETIFQ